MRAVLLLALSATLSASDLAVIRTTGQYDTDGTILYSVYVATGAQKIGEVAVGGNVPLGTRFIESLDVPAGVTFDGVRDNVAVWSLKEIEADRLVGPFTFRAKPDGAGTIITEPPAAVSYRQPEIGLVVYNGGNTPLFPLESKGSLSFDARGTLNEKGENVPVFVGKTGVLFFAPQGAVNLQTTISFERQILDETKLPQAEEPLWWCGLFKVTLSNPVPLAKAVSFSFPTRRPLTPGLRMAVASNEDDSWAKPSNVRTIGFGGGGFGCNFNCGFGSGFGGGFGGFGGQFGGGFGGGGFGGAQFGFGVSTADRTRSSVSGAELSTVFGFPTTATAAIVDGTSNIIAILIGRR